MFSKLIAALLLVWSSTAMSPTTKDETITLTPANSVALRGEVSNESVSRWIDKIYNSTERSLFLFIDSPGGDVTSGLRFIEAMRASGKHTVCIAKKAESMAFTILQQCDERVVMSDSLLMQHVGSYGLGGPVPNNESLFVLNHKIFEGLHAMDAKRIGMVLNLFEAKIRDDWWLLGPEAVKENVADRIVMVACSKDLAKRRETFRQTVRVQCFDATYSGCPLASAPLEVKASAGPCLSSDEIDQLGRKFIQNN